MIEWVARINNALPNLPSCRDAHPHVSHRSVKCAQRQPEGYDKAQEPRLVAYHPAALDLAALRGWEEYQALLQALASVALAAGRVPVWPDVPCSVPWIAEDGPEVSLTHPMKTVA